MDLIKLTKEGFISSTYDQNKHDYKRRGNLTLVNEITNQTQRFSSEEELSAFLRISTLIDGNYTNILPFLIERLVIDEGVTIDDFHNAIQQHPVLEGIICSCFPEYPKIQGFTNSDEPAEVLVLSKELKVNTNSENNIQYHQGFTNNRNWVGSTKLEINDNFNVVFKNETISGESPITLWDFIVGLFESSNKETVIVRPDGVYKNDIKLENPICELNSFCEISEDLKVKDIFRLVENDQMLKTFFSCYSWCSFIDDLHEFAEKPIEESTLGEVWFAEVYHIMDYGNYGKLGEVINSEVGFHGIGEQKSEKTGEPEKVNWSLSLSPMNEIAELELSYKKTCSFYKDFQDSHQFEMKITLQEFISAIYWDLSFYGSPKQAEEVKQNLKESVETIKKQILEE